MATVRGGAPCCGLMLDSVGQCYVYLMCASGVYHLGESDINLDKTLLARVA